MFDYSSGSALVCAYHWQTTRERFDLRSSNAFFLRGKYKGSRAAQQFSHLRLRQAWKVGESARPFGFFFSKIMLVLADADQFCLWQLLLHDFKSAEKILVPFAQTQASFVTACWV